MGLQHQPRRKRLAVLAEVAARITETYLGACRRVDDGEAREHGMHGFFGAVAGAPQRGTDALPLGVEQHGIFHRGRKHAPLFEADDEEEGTVGNAGLRQPGHVKVAGPRSIATDAETFDALADEAERHRHRATERAERTQFRDGVLQGNRRNGVERARLCRTGSEKRQRGIDDVVNRNLFVFRARSPSE